MRLEIAQPDQNGELKEFFKEFPLDGLLQLKVDRGQDFFEPYNIQSDQSVTYALRDETTNHLEGIATFLVREVKIEDQIQKVAFARDLRISKSRKAIMAWGQHVLPVMQEVKKIFGVKHFFSTLNMNEVRALNTFLRPREHRRTLPRYYLYRRFNMVSVHGRFPFAKNPLPHLRVRRASARTWKPLVDYIIRKSRAKNLSMYYNEGAIQGHLDRWKNLHIDDFLMAVDGNHNIIGCVAPWSSGGIQDLVPMSYSLRAHNFRQFLKFGNLLGWTRTLTKPFSRLKVEAPLNFRYLNFLYADNEDIFEILLNAAFDEARTNEFLVYPQMRADLHLRPPLNWISAQTKYGLYCLLPPDENPPTFLHPSHDRSVELDPFSLP